MNMFMQLIQVRMASLYIDTYKNDMKHILLGKNCKQQLGQQVQDDVNRMVEHYYQRCTTKQFTRSIPTILMKLMLK